MGLFDKFKKKETEPLKFREEPKKKKDAVVAKSQTPRVFEDCFMDIQTDMVALCVEFAGDHPVDEIYIYGSIEAQAVSFNAFYVTQGKVLTTSKLSNDISMVKQFLRLGSSDLEKLSEVCKTYNRPVPTELRLRYITSSKKFDSHYEYKSICNIENNIFPSDVFMAWIKSIEEEIESN